ncbi:ferritin-like domain-containing protein [Hymenobacter weizhouensis]|uniref:ferritin-like domain-containing protein n=1 Tax=Hymenobacter sp. YIM 151500-1 TaxID=2987689 RepID=UPI00222672E1|nr:ferritin-like domain-containing protein [Hymenobacter sp. YIM 151500-1]UYZ61879.1 ferritin-like domain-containing protein [Hymenobacter sp. YIM 151500-1]
MDLFKLISDIEKVDPEIYERLDPRRRVFQHFGTAGKALTAAALPVVFSGIFQRAYGQAALPADIQAVLNLALSLEYLEFYFYDTGLKTPGLIPATDRPAFEVIRNDESGHIKTLRAALGTAAIPEPTRAAFDYSGGRGTQAGPFAAVFSNYALYLGVSQSFVDTGIRAYKGGAPILMPNKTVLQAALNIHSVEARHSSHVRTVRRGVAANAVATTVPGNPANLNLQPKSWVSGNDNGGPSPNTTPSTAAVYGPGNPATGAATAVFFPGEENITQAGVNIQTNTTLTGATVTAAAASEAFDEPLDAATVKGIARNFVLATTTLFT